MHGHVTQTIVFKWQYLENCISQTEGATLNHNKVSHVSRIKYTTRARRFSAYYATSRIEDILILVKYISQKYAGACEGSQARKACTDVVMNSARIAGSSAGLMHTMHLSCVLMGRHSPTIIVPFYLYDRETLWAGF